MSAWWLALGAALAAPPVQSVLIVRDVSVTMEGQPAGEAVVAMLADQTARHRAELAYCHQLRLAELPDLSGEVTLEFRVVPAPERGRGLVPARPVVGGGLTDEATRKCLSMRPQRWAYSELPAPADVRLDLSLHPVQVGPPGDRMGIEPTPGLPRSVVHGVVEDTWSQVWMARQRSRLEGAGVPAEAFVGSVLLSRDATGRVSRAGVIWSVAPDGVLGERLESIYGGRRDEALPEEAVVRLTLDLTEDG